MYDKTRHRIRKLMLPRLMQCDTMPYVVRSVVVAVLVLQCYVGRHNLIGKAKEPMEFSIRVF